MKPQPAPRRLARAPCAMTPKPRMRSRTPTCARTVRWDSSAVKPRSPPGSRGLCSTNATRVAAVPRVARILSQSSVRTITWRHIRKSANPGSRRTSLPPGHNCAVCSSRRSASRRIPRRSVADHRRAVGRGGRRITGHLLKPCVAATRARPVAGVLAREIDLAESDVFEFGGQHCDQIVASVLARMTREGAT
jgi:hypothetical protein